MSKFHAAFESNPSIAQRIKAIVNSDHDYTGIFEDISDHVLCQNREIQDLRHRLGSAPSYSAIETQSKRRKLSHEGGKSTEQKSNGTCNIGALTNGRAVCTARDISFLVPTRKKMVLEIVTDTGQGDGGVRATNTNSGDVRFGLPWHETEQVIAVPVAEKVQPTYNFIVVPCATTGAPLASSDSHDCIIWTVPATGPPKNIAFSDDEAIGDDETCFSALLRILNKELKRFGKRVELPNPQEFLSGIVQAHRKEEKAFHVKAWRGSKDGFLYFLGPGILFGFRKPVLFFPFASISSISYTSVLARTFNLVISAFPPTSQEQNASVEPVDMEFSMLDQADFTGVDAYIKRHGLHDASLAARRRAEQCNVNKQRSLQPSSSNQNGTNATDGGQGSMEDDEGDLARAERAMQDAEDEEEEDFDPGSGGESDGSGSDSEEDEGAGESNVNEMLQDDEELSEEES